ncbi:hypothetical protein LP087_13675 (plasmid) [Moraxella bovis]|uniref:hypothetical protein n=1 Tax=Moraxella bovis TaxID=476 RepID=UPI00222647C5|nr:hypothetical protein [Moraxella bovis]UZA34045.1 hypothetical protein LP087_13675 [Moraxella bovis]UZA49962.1 hypothetical protein LP100_14075 [Moraxella bovis]
MSSGQQTRFDSFSIKRKLLIVLSIFYIVLCGSLGIYISQEELNIDMMARIAVLIILVFNMFLPFFMVHIWEIEDKLSTNQNGS